MIGALARDTKFRPAAFGDHEVLEDLDAQIALWTLYELHYRGFEGVRDEREWDSDLIAFRQLLERRLLGELRRRIPTSQVVTDGQIPHDVGAYLLAMVADDRAAPLASHLQRSADRDQVLDFLRERSVTQLKESDPQSFVLPRLEGGAKVALAELQYDEYGAGRDERLHETLYATALADAGLDASYGAYVDRVSAASLARANVMSLFALNRSFRGAALGHYAAFEASSSVPSRKIAAGIERVGLPASVAAYFLEHVEADAVHEQLAARRMCGAFVALEPDLWPSVRFGAACSLYLDNLVANDLLSRWGVIDGADDEPETAGSRLENAS